MPCFCRIGLMICFLWCSHFGVMTLTLQSNDTIPERGEGLQLSCLTSVEFINDTIQWISPQNVRLSTCHAIYKLCTDNSSSYSFTTDNKGAYAYINSLSRMQDSGTWKCVYRSSTANTEITVYTSPAGAHLVQPIPRDRDLGVESLTLTCQTDNCSYPAPAIAWYYRTTSGQTALYQGSTGSMFSNTDACTQSEVTYTSTLKLLHGTTFTDNIPFATKFVCGIQHPAFKEGIIYSQNSNSVTFAVNLTSLTLRDSYGNDLPNTVELVNGTAVTLMCVTSTSRPTATVNWYLDNTRITSGINNVVKTGSNGLEYLESKLTFIPSNKEHHNKMIYCQAYLYNSYDFLQSGKSTMFVKVQVVSITLYDSTSGLVASVLPVVDGIPTILRCDTTLSRPPSIITWYRGDSLVHDNATTTNLTSNGLDYVSSSLNLTLSNNDHEQVIYCQAYNIDPLVRVISVRAKLHVTVYVRYITMSPSGSPLIFLEGIEKIIQCAAGPSRPRSQMRWWLGAEQVMNPISESISSSGNLIVTSSVISLTLNRSHAHRLLYCDTTVLGQQTWIPSSKYDIDVMYAPDVKVNISGFAAVSSAAVLMCVPQGNPPQYTFHPWIHTIGQTEIRRLDGVNTVSLSTLSLSNISIQDMGTYICTVDNSITGLDGQINQMGDTYVYVQGLPIFDKTQSTFTGETNTSTNIEIPFFSYLFVKMVKFIRQLDSVEISNTSDISIYIQPSNITMMFYMKKVIMPGHVAVLYFRNLTDTDFGNYTLQLSNDQGTVSVQFEFIASAPPSMPKKFVFIHIKDGCLVFRIEKGFNGGSEQTFVVEYQPFGLSDTAWSTIFKINETDLDDPFSNGTYFIKIPKIQDGKYVFRVYAENRKGNSSAKEGVQVEIKTELPMVNRDVPVGAVVGGVIGAVVLVIAIITVAFVIKKRTLKPKLGENMKREAYGSKGPEYINTAFRSDISTTEYEALQSGQTGASQYEALNDPKSKLNQSTDISISADPRLLTGEMFYDKLQPCETNEGHMYSSLSSPRLDDGENKFYENAVMSTKYIHE